MENEQNDKITEFDTDLDNGFKIDYKNQILKNNAQFINWKKSMIKKYGNDARLFKCSQDNLLFFTSNNECKNNFFGINCPSCKRKICYFCSRFSQNEMFIGNCCLKRGIYYVIFDYGKSYFSKYNDGLDPPPASFIKLFFTPFFYIQFFITMCLKFCFLGLPMKNAEDKDDGILTTYEDYYKTNHKISYQIILFLFRCFFCFLPVPYILIDIEFHIFLLIISLPFKGYPICYYFGIIFGGYRPYIKEVLSNIYGI